MRMMEKTEGTVQKMAGKAQDAIGGMVGDTGTQLEGKARQLAGQAQQSYGEALDQIRDVARSNPVAAVAVAAAVGFLVGTLMSRR
jgi:uncharacterized protein YjbJ (UPF0337 family)